MMSFDITRYHELTVPKLSQSPLSTPNAIGYPFGKSSTDAKTILAVPALTTARSVLDSIPLR